ncbi:MAG: DinB family protein [Treponema sp.]|jgi:uncharacterized damage-inducible protein DinB|nr:DinB family protein [Treponema sp.]
MKDVFLLWARYNREANQKVYSLLTGMSNEDRETDRSSYYGSLSSLFRHILGGTSFFLGMFRSALPDRDQVQKTLAPLEGIILPKDRLSEAQWNDLGAARESLDRMLEDFAGLLADDDFRAPVKLGWYGGNPGSVPLHFLLHNLNAHGVHHRGQISQILDELKIDNDYSGINVQFLRP